ncbi:YeeE/YedE family protein (DUF395) [Thermanaerovibrio velox DSM 12556]|uniref:YeeE/YedE family protein (DUF395) n=1 Tax=Thermanaerovibrio velox DSM 12556 TaxID=926567 RepID=H0UPU9_9BACT|nr:YedE family putative selenium transporter [Thermanaerovibrio velox]EHM10658.1 YeeE/YedE family protein (DUF395) [Thermanaerovibrio velox DSM 12556]
MRCFLTSKWGPVATGVVVGILAPILVHLGNPGNMGMCVACFTRDIAGALGLHRAAIVQYLRPEIPGLLLGAFGASMVFGEMRPRGGSSPITRFFLGVFAMVGALIFLGCPWRAYLRLAGGDLTAVAGILGLISGIGIGIGFLWKGFNLGRSRPTSKASGYVMPVVMLGLLALLAASPLMGRTPEGDPTGPIFFSAKGPGSMHASVAVSLAVGAIIGWMAQRSRFCTVGAFRDLIMLKDPHLFWGIAALVVSAAVTNAALGQFKLGVEGQPVAQPSHLWNFLGMMLSGLAFTLAGGCPGRQVIMSGEGDSDAGVFVLGMLVGAAVAHNFTLASSVKGPSPYVMGAWALGMLFCLAVGFLSRNENV